MSPTDGELLDRWRGGESASGEELFERYYDTVERFFLNKVTGTAVQDLVQETFTRCVESRERIRENEQFRLYLFGIAYHVLHEYVRRRYRQGHSVEVSESSMRDLEPGPATLVVQRREHRLLLEALRSIPLEDQVIVELHYWELLTTEDIAEALGIPVGTARGRLQRARTKLAEMMHRLTESRDELTSTIARLEDWAKGCRASLTDMDSDRHGADGDGDGDGDENDAAR